jgi:predicted amidophosphoribosyltransferase
MSFKQLLANFQPTCCALCFERQAYSICNRCLTDLQYNEDSKKCLICGRPNFTWVCKSCATAKRSFDQTICLYQDTSRLFSLVKSCDAGKLAFLPALMQAWQHSCEKKMLPVDLMVPLPESIRKSQSRGFWFALEFAKCLQKLNGTEIESNYIVYSEQENQQHTFALNPQMNHLHPFLGKRIAVVIPYLKWDYPAQQFAFLLKKHGARWVTYWVLIRNSQKE